MPDTPGPAASSPAQRGRGTVGLILTRGRDSVARWPSWWPIAVAVALTSPLTLYWWNLIAAGSITFDWDVYVEAGRRVREGSPDLYDQSDIGFKHSPIFAYAVSALAWIGSGGIRLVTLAAAFAMPNWPMRLLTVSSWPFAMDLQHGALITIIVCVAAWALRGSRAAGLAFVALAMLSPRPLMVPIGVYLLWRQPELRIPSAVLFVAHGLAVLATGYADDWASVLLTVGTEQVATMLNLSPSRFLGNVWIPIGIGLAAWLTYRGRPGLAALAISPYVLPHYLLLGLLELRGATSSQPHRLTDPPGGVGYG